MTRAWTPRPATAKKLDALRERRERIVHRVASGESITKVAVAEGISRQRVSQIIHERGLHLGVSRETARGRAVRDSMVLLVRSGHSLEHVAEWFGITTTQARNALYRAGIRLGRRPRTPRHGTATEYKAYGCRCEACRAANAAQVRAWMNGPGKAVTVQRARAYRRARPHADRAWQAVNRALRSGQLVKPERCVCGRDARVNAHHDDYSRPLDVMWLCGVCHKARHEVLKRLKAA